MRRRPSILAISILVLRLAACSGDYPLPPTACDEWCEATRSNTCPDLYDPAGCVSNCEHNHFVPAGCRSQLDDFVRCLRQHPSVPSSDCSFPESTQKACQNKIDALAFCAGNFAANRGPE